MLEGEVVTAEDKLAVCSQNVCGGKGIWWTVKMIQIISVGAIGQSLG